jgi:hypothetical protein
VNGEEAVKLAISIIDNSTNETSSNKKNKTYWTDVVEPSNAD